MIEPNPVNSVKRQLTRLILTVSLGVLGFTGVALFVFEVRSYRIETSRSLMTTGSIIAENSAAVLLYDDKKMAAEILGGLHVEPVISAAALFDRTGKVYATFPKTIAADTLPALPGADGVVLDLVNITVQMPVMQGESRVGTLFLKGNLIGMYQRLSTYGAVLLWVGLCSIGVAALLSKLLQRRISDPLAALAATARAVTTLKDYSVRAAKSRTNEFGELTEALNSMLDQIQTSSAALREGEARFRTLADNIAQLAWMAEADGYLTWYNKRWFDYTGTTFEEMKGWGWQKVHHPNHVARVTEKFQRAVAAGEDWEDTFPLRGKDGLFRWFLSRAIPIRDETGAIVRWFGTNTDVTEQRLAQEGIQAHAHRAEVLSQVATELFFAEAPGTSLKTILPRIATVLSADYYFHYMVEPEGGRLILSSAAGLTPEQEAACRRVAFGEALCGSCALQDAPLVVEEVQASTLAATSGVRALGVRAYACYPLRSGGRMVGTLAFATRSRDRFGPPELQFINTVSDVLGASIERARLLKELRETRDVAEQASAAKDGFLAALSHELRTPLNPVLLLASEAAADDTLDPRVRDDFAMIAKNVTVESQLIDDLLDLTKITQGKLDLEMRSIDVHDVLRDALGLVNAEISEKRIIINLKLEPGTHYVRADPVRLQQIFWNVLKNAVKFSPDEGVVVISSKSISAGRRLSIEISDRGIGLTNEELARVFEAFSQGDHAKERGAHRFGGLGLGLAISRNLVELHGGSLHATSRGRGHGATFTVELPLAPVAAPLAGRVKPAAPLSPQPRSRWRILLVEDHNATRSTIVTLLERRGHQVSAAGSVAAARTLANENTFDLVISDIGLPDETGYVLMAELRARFGLTGIALSGYGTATDIQRGQDAGFVAHLTKPVKIQDLDATIASVLRAPEPKSSREDSVPMTQSRS